jgi:hypothetical protein
VDAFTLEAEAEVLGPKVIKLIVMEMALRDGRSSLPPRNEAETPRSTLALRGKTAIHAYSLWAATFVFRRLAASIKSSVHKFQPRHDAVVSFQFSVSSLLICAERSRTIPSFVMSTSKPSSLLSGR